LPLYTIKTLKKKYFSAELRIGTHPSYPEESSIKSEDGEKG
jgi:hypothetical protein